MKKATHRFQAACLKSVDPRHLYDDAQAQQYAKMKPFGITLVAVIQSEWRVG